MANTYETVNRFEKFSVIVVTITKMIGKLTIIKKKIKKLIKEYDDYKIYTKKIALNVTSAELKCETRWTHPVR